MNNTQKKAEQETEKEIEKETEKETEKKRPKERARDKAREVQSSRPRVTILQKDELRASEIKKGRVSSQPLTLFKNSRVLEGFFTTRSPSSSSSTREAPVGSVSMLGS